MTAAWLDFWNGTHSIYVSDRHRAVHYRLIAQDIAAIVPFPQARVLDYGCGEALHADIVAAAAGELLLCEGAPRVRDSIAGRFAQNPKIRVMAPPVISRLPDHSIDFIVFHSVAQYLSPEEADVLFVLFHRLLKPNGLLMVSDIVPPTVAATTDAAVLLRFAAANGFLRDALIGLMRTAVSDYRHLRKRLGLTRYTEAAMTDKLAHAGFSSARSDKNLGNNQVRMAFIARPRGG